MGMRGNITGDIAIWATLIKVITHPLSKETLLKKRNQPFISE